MAEFHRAAVACGIAASVFGMSYAHAFDAPAAPQAEPADVAVAVGAGAPEGGSSCPRIVIAPNAAAFPQGADDHKATVEGIARDCAIFGAETILKVAVVGEGERDGGDGPNSFNAPLKLSVTDGDGKPVETRKIKVKFDLPTGVRKVAFRHVEENVSLPPVDGGYANWTVTVGFDASADEPAPAAVKPARSRAAKRAVRAARLKSRPAPAPMPPVQTVAAPAPAPQTGFAKLSAYATAQKTRARDVEIERRRQQAVAAGRPIGDAPRAAQPAAARGPGQTTPVPVGTAQALAAAKLQTAPRPQTAARSGSGAPTRIADAKSR